jgi:histidinol dehydrogenase
VSSVLMGIIPAKVAGVKQVVMTTPPTKDGGINPHLLVAARKAGADAVYKAGSAWAIAALAYGTQTIPRVDVVVGPGNIYVTLAKKILAGTVGIDMIAGPSEILVIADETANSKFIAADLLSQAEHDILSSAILITDSKKMAEAVAKEVRGQVAPLARADIAVKSLETYGAIIVVENMNLAFEMANRIAPEHLELQIKDAFEYVGKIRNAGAVFVGDYTPEAVGDYIAGPNHVLPTAGAARFASALSVDNFIKKTSLIHYTRKAFQREAPDVIRLAETERLGAHARSVKVRL